MPETTSFGFRDIPAGEKAGRVRQVFEAVAGRYDLMNDLMSGGLHHLWKQAMIDRLCPRPGQKVIDVAGGTGDIAFRLHGNVMPDGNVTVCDINLAMIAVGRDRAINANRLTGLEWVCGNAEFLPFSDRHADAVTIAFGIRNVTDIPAALAEMRRVLKPGGRFLCLEFSPAVLPPLQALYDRYSFEVIPRLGQWVTGDRAPYAYLVESIRRFPAPDDFSALCENAGFIRVSHQSLTGGVAGLWSGWRV